MQGHCNFDEEGKDLICAAASILCLTLAQVIEENEDKLKSKPKLKTEKGICDIHFIAKPKFNAALSNSFYTVLTGLRILEYHYPECLSIRELRIEN